MKTRGFGSSHAGQRRPSNEDSFYVDAALGLFVVADGMGGCKAGDVASSIAIDTVTRVVRRHLAAAGAGDVEALVALVARAAAEASRTVHAAARAEDRLQGMGCTLTILLVAGTHAIVGHVGDSRLYLLRDRFSIQLTADHTMAQALADEGVLTQSEVKRHPFSHMLTRAIGHEPDVEVDTRVVELLRGDRFLLCTDGLTAYVDDPNWLGAQVVGGEDLAAAPERLIRHANASGGADNVTVVIAEVGDSAAADRSRAETLPCVTAA